ncbi:MAG: NADPH:quinone oxidoreductase family protein [Acidimicrobiia bacterium]|nr:NADPH:quinone oxidoreductase family protein [Acidimicrobiia bacterium]
MRAWMCRAWGEPEDLDLSDVPDPEPGPGQAVVRVEACGVNFPDGLIVAGKYQFRPEFPFTPGGEVCGTVTAVGAGVTNVEVGQRVIAVTAFGGMAEKILVPRAQSVIPIPEEIPAETAAAFMLTYATSHHALKDRAEASAGESLLVLGAAGGVGLAAVELGAAMGLEVTAAASTTAKLELARTKGASHTINYADEDLRERAKEITGGVGFDIVYDPVGGDLSEVALRSTTWKGRFLVVGFAAGEIPSIPLNLTLLKGCDIRGVFWGRFVEVEPERAMGNFVELMQMLADGTIAPHVSEVFDFDHAPDAIRHVIDRKALGKVVVSLP